MENKRFLVDTIMAAWRPEKGDSLDLAVRRAHRERLSVIDKRTEYLLSTFGHLDGNEISTLVEALDQRGRATFDAEGLKALRDLAADAGDAICLLASVMPEEGPFRPMYVIVAEEFKKVGELFEQRLEAFLPPSDQ